MQKKMLIGLTMGVFLLGGQVTANALPVNGGFETGNLTPGWTFGGQADVQDDVVHGGSYAAYVGTVDHDNDEKNDFTGAAGTDGYKNNWLAQTVDVQGMNSLDIWYNFFTWDSVGYDDPGFEIQINNVSVFSISAGDLDTTDDYTTLDSTDWQVFTYDLSAYNATTLELTIYAGNTGDTYVQSWVYIDMPEGNAPAPVPEPATMLLFGTGLAGLAGLRRRQAKK